MAEQITLTTLSSLTNQTSALTSLNNNFTTIQTALQDVMALGGTTPNSMQSPLDMNSNQIINLPPPASAGAPLRLQDAATLNGGGTVTALPTGGVSGQVLTKTTSANYIVAWSSISDIPTTTTANQMLQSTITAQSVWSTAIWPATVAGAGYVIASNGTNSWVASNSPTLNSVTAVAFVGTTGAFNVMTATTLSGTSSIQVPGVFLVTPSQVTYNVTGIIQFANATMFYEDTGTSYTYTRYVGGGAASGFYIGQNGSGGTQFGNVHDAYIVNNEGVNGRLILGANGSVTELILNPSGGVGVGNIQDPGAGNLLVNGTIAMLGSVAGQTVTLKAFSSGSNATVTVPSTTDTLATFGYVGIMRAAATSVNFNSASTDTVVPIALPNGVSRFAVNSVRIDNASAAITTATLGVFTATTGAGYAYATTQACTVNTNANTTLNNTQSLVLNTVVAVSGPNLYVRTGASQGSAVTADVIITYIPLT